MNKKYYIIFVLVLALLLPTSNLYAAETGTKTVANVTVDGVSVSFDAYTIKGNNYFKLRDIAYALSGTTKAFDVTWAGDKNAINMLSHTNYTVVGGEMGASHTQSTKTATLSTATFYLDGEVVHLTTYTIDNNNYIKLRDLGSTFNFGVTWDEATNTIAITSGMAYQPELIVLETYDLADTHRNRVSNWANVSPVQQFAYKSEGLGYAFVQQDMLQIVTPTHQMTVPMRYPLLGDVIADAAGNIYIVWGKEGTVSTDETLFISKYTIDGTLVKTVGFVGDSPMGQDGNTKIPFDAGNCVSAIGNGYLMVNYAREMYSGHQSNNVVGVSIADMTPYTFKTRWDVPYTSHSFNQSILWNEASSTFIYADHGDAYGRGFIISSDFGEKQIFTFYLESNVDYNMWVVNKTFAQLGGLAQTSKGTVFVGASAKSISESAKKEYQNLFIQIFNPEAETVAASMFVGGTTRSGATSFDINDNKNSPLTKTTDYGVQWLTNYTNTNAITPQVVVADDRVVILWASEKDSFYMVLDASGKVLTPATSLKGTLLNAYERPIYYNGSIYWAYSQEGKLKIKSVKIG